MSEKLKYGFQIRQIFFLLKKINSIEIFHLIWLSLYLFPSLSVGAQCKCECFKGEVQLVCKNQKDIKPICKPFMCQKELNLNIPNIEPPQSIKLESKTNCEELEKPDFHSGRYISRQVCK